MQKTKFSLLFFILLFTISLLTHCSNLVQVKDKTPPFLLLPKIGNQTYQNVLNQNSQYSDYSLKNTITKKTKVHWLWNYPKGANLYPLFIFKMRMIKLAKKLSFDFTKKSFSLTNSLSTSEPNSLSSRKKLLHKMEKYLQTAKVNLVVISTLKWDKKNKMLLVHELYNPRTKKKISSYKQSFSKEKLDTKNESTSLFLKFKKKFRPLTQQTYAPYISDWNSFEDLLSKQVKKSSGGLIDISIINPNAKILINGENVNRPITAYYLKEGFHLIKATRKGFASKEKKILVTAFSRQKIYFRWKDDDKISGLKILSFPQGKKVYLAKTYKGNTPQVFPKLLAGNYSLAITSIPEGEKEEYYLYNGKIKFKANKNLSVAFLKNYKLNFAQYFQKNKEPFPFWISGKNISQNFIPENNGLSLHSLSKKQQWFSLTSIKIFPTSFHAVLQLENPSELPFIFSVNGIKEKEGFSLFSEKESYWAVNSFPVKKENAEIKNSLFKSKEKKKELELVLDYNHQEGEFKITINGDSIYQGKGKFSSLFYFNIYSKPNSKKSILLKSISIQSVK